MNSFREQTVSPSKVMAQSLSPIAAATLSTKKTIPLAFHDKKGLDKTLLSRRSLALGLVGVALNAGNDKANAAARRPPPPPPTSDQEKKDPNMSGVMAKVLASKRRKEAMKETIAKLREKGKPVNEPSQ